MAPNYVESKAAGHESLLHGISNLFASPKYADLVVTCGERQWALHKAVVCARSGFFEKACNDDAASSSALTIHDDPEVLEKVIRYLYHGEYEDSDIEITPMVLNVRMVVAAEKYSIDHLAGLAVSKLAFHTEHENGWSTEDFADAIEEAYTWSTDNGLQLRATLLEAVQKRTSELFNGYKDQYSYFKAMATNTPGFTAELAAVLCRENSTRVYRCPDYDCRGLFRAEIQDGEALSYECEECGMLCEYEYAEWQKFAAKPRLLTAHRARGPAHCDSSLSGDESCVSDG